jgi:hypothetical protein
MGSGTSKAMMIACVSPSDVYIEETMSTLNYATRTMNIKNKPIIQMDAKEQIILNLRREIQLLKMENDYLKGKLYLLLQMCRMHAGIPIDLPSSTYHSVDTSSISLPPINAKGTPPLALPPSGPLGPPPVSSKSSSKGGGMLGAVASSIQSPGPNPNPNLSLGLGPNPIPNPNPNPGGHGDGRARKVRL